MRSIVRYIVGVIIVVALGLIAGLLLPRHVDVSRAIVINAPSGAIWPLVSDLRRFNEWSPWASIDPEGTTYHYEGAKDGVGQRMVWRSAHPDVGSGSHEITEIDPGRSVTAQLRFGELGKAEANIILTPAGHGTEVTWDFATDLGMNPVRRWLGLFIDGWVGKDYEAGLERLKQLAEPPSGR
ncbi:carbon monoxide dehydrogenase subunit G [Tepidamorphus gemmatus]|uniref:Carbon monoxide dehydrogenase subunit G n=1 Tax=Tepidamorphus gemmatus TaxID=747076 RepID=A0A4R3MNP3_9HYPH|nr:SRPBCC family protein [Tepidamorphus gemmatus]TCT13676.1 carbon monoxide dehydrogenase subunit G [Tepidamorphus gemmatus]